MQLNSDPYAVPPGDSVRQKLSRLLLLLAPLQMSVIRRSRLADPAVAALRNASTLAFLSFQSDRLAADHWWHDSDSSTETPTLRRVIDAARRLEPGFSHALPLREFALEDVRPDILSSTEPTAIEVAIRDLQSHRRPIGETLLQTMLIDWFPSRTDWDITLPDEARAQLSRPEDVTHAPGQLSLPLKFDETTHLVTVPLLIRPLQPGAALPIVTARIVTSDSELAAPEAEPEAPVTNDPNPAAQPRLSESWLTLPLRPQPAGQPGSRAAGQPGSRAAGRASDCQVEPALRATGHR